MTGTSVILRFQRVFSWKLNRNVEANINCGFFFFFNLGLRWNHEKPKNWTLLAQEPRNINEVSKFELEVADSKFTFLVDNKIVWWLDVKKNIKNLTMNLYDDILLSLYCNLDSFKLTFIETFKLWSACKIKLWVVRLSLNI